MDEKINKLDYCVANNWPVLNQKGLLGGGNTENVLAVFCLLSFLAVVNGNPVFFFFSFLLTPSLFDFLSFDLLWNFMGNCFTYFPLCSVFHVLVFVSAPSLSSPVVPQIPAAAQSGCRSPSSFWNCGKCTHDTKRGLQARFVHFSSAIFLVIFYLVTVDTDGKWMTGDYILFFVLFSSRVKLPKDIWANLHV